MLSRILMTVMCIACPSMACIPLVSVPDPNQPQRIALAIYALDERSGNETSIPLVLRAETAKSVPGSIANEGLAHQCHLHFPSPAAETRKKAKS